MSHRAAFNYNTVGELEYSRTKPHKPTEPNPLHPTFYSVGNYTGNREMERRYRRRYFTSSQDKVGHRKSVRTDKANKIKRQVKTISLRQHRPVTIIWAMRNM